MENPKALNLTSIKNSSKKVTLGFKCSPKLKILLAEKASINGLTLSSYVESTLSEYQSTIGVLEKKNKELNLANFQLSLKTKFYENDNLKKLYNDHQGKTVTYINSKGEEVNHKIVTIEDVYTVLINSFK